MLFVVFLITASCSALFEASIARAHDSDVVPRASRSVLQQEALSTADNAAQLAESGNSHVASPNEATYLIVADSHSLQNVLEQLQAEIQQLQTEMAAKDQRIQVLEQRDYIERCESGDLASPNNIFTSGDGARFLDLTATFSRAFRTTPVVTVGLTALDHFPGHTRAIASVVSVSTTSLTVRIGTWASSQLFAAYVHWMACA